MNTQSHAILTFWILRKSIGDQTLYVKNINPILISGALIPDLPLYIFFFFYTVIFPTPQSHIWRELYFQQNWQVYFSMFHSFPVWGLLSLLFLVIKKRGAALFFSAALIASIQDFLVHHEDAHAHLFPFSDYRFASPISYWNPAYFGTYFSIFEIFAVIVASIWSYHKLDSKWGRIILVFAVILLIAGNNIWSFVFNYF